MTPAELREWREHARLSQRAAADALGLTLATWQRYERGEDWTTHAAVEVPRWMVLACAAIDAGLSAG